MQQPATVSWGLHISDADFRKLKAGFEPRDQDDKWRVLVTNQSNTNRIIVNFSRSSGRELYRLDVKPNEGASAGGEIEEITWAQDKGGIHISEEQAKKEIAILSRSVLKCDLETLPRYHRSEMWNHPAAQLGSG